MARLDTPRTLRDRLYKTFRTRAPATATRPNGAPRHLEVCFRTPAVFVNSINGADGLIIDEHDNLGVAANQADEIVVLDPTGRVMAKLGDFGGIDRRRRPRGLPFPASLVRHGEFIYVTNLAIDLRGFDDPNQSTLTNGTVDSQWAAEVKIHTISKIRARIPRVQGLPMDDETNE